MADCDQTSIGETPSTYSRSSGWEASGLTAAGDVALVNGKVGVVTIGMSSMNNISVELVARYHADLERNPNTTVINGGISGKVSRSWSNPDDDCWTTLETRITTAGLTLAQCQVFWVVMTNSHPHIYGAMTEAQMVAIWQNVDAKFPNARIGFHSSHPYTGYSTDDRAPEPGIHADSLLLASLVGHGSFPFWVDFYDIWADGMTPNERTALVGSTESADDPLFYECTNFGGDGVHPKMNGSRKIEKSIRERWRVDPVAIEAMLWLGEGDPEPPPPEPPKRGIFLAGS